METVRQIQGYRKDPTSQPRPLNDNNIRPLSMGRSIFPDEAVARIYSPSRSVTTSGKARKKCWRLAFERRAAPFIEPLMGYTGSRDTLTQVELEFRDLASAIRYANRHGLAYVVRRTADRYGRSEAGSQQPGRASHAFADATLERLGLARLQECYGLALDGAVGRDDPSGPESWSSPMDVVLDPKLTLAAKRSILMNWAWSEYLIDQATNEGMPENRPSRLDEVEHALLVLEQISRSVA
ncbi:ETC complex I subunit-like protein [Rhizobium azibense]|uniref:ETC complex I subunit-like protein n=1 Tax=Rhizobium azibense TaxID=1136135 RepID=A0A4R3R8R6_9HYPH|nr:NADH dehydrogenase ubiquinone Fe-S protein 4 [Rhizobium azibense]TCU30734.1 ETC complex I subunit-like protein [Rhizobium azibense]